MALCFARRSIAKEALIYSTLIYSILSFPRKRESMFFKGQSFPAFAGTTLLDQGPSDMKLFIACLGIGTLILLNQIASAGPMRERIAERVANSHLANDLEKGEDDGGASGKSFLPAGASVQRDIAYGADSSQRMDVYIPRNSHGATVVFMVHGGAWRIGDKASAGVVENKVARWLGEGMVFVSVNYRMLPKADPITQADDVAAALAKAQALAASWGADPSRFILMGHSAGAHLIALIASAPAIAKKEGVQPWLGTVLLDSAALDVVKIMASKHHRLYDSAFGSDASYWRTTSPFHRLSDTTAPLLAVCSTQRNNSCPQARGFVAKATSIGVRSSVLAVDLSHKEINRDLGVPGSYTEGVELFMRSLSKE
jgi:arylformamidase